MPDKHAYLVMSHSNFNQLLLLLDLLDDERNDIYLHIDKKSNGYSIDEIRHHVKKSKLVFIKPMRVSWGGDSGIKCELRLLVESTKTPHAYYHLISGMDLPLKTQDEIHAFFRQHCGCDFVALNRKHIHNLSKSYMYRLNYYYMFQNFIGRNKDGFSLKLQWLQNKHLKLQKKLNICRTKNSKVEFQKGSNWFSITHETARYVVNEYKKYKRYFEFTLCADEVFLQTILINSPRIDSIIDNNLRYIDWERGEPYTFRIEDFDTLLHSEKMFARKFDITVDKTIIYKIRDILQKR